jgi:hypothetical protein
MKANGYRACQLGESVNDKTEQTSGPPTPTVNPPLHVELRVREWPGADVATGQASGNRLPENALRYVVLLVVMVIAGVYTGLHMGRGWVPADDGTLSQSALRVLQGQLPHRDFGEIYTGGLSLIHALAFRLFGVNLMSLRICVFLFFLSWLPVVYWVALRFTSAMPAGLVTLVAVAWSYPNYPAAMPSWYNLFFATFGAAALLRYLDVEHRRWLFIAGICGGISILIKVIGAYYIAGVLLFLAFREQGEAAENDQPANSWPYRILSGGALILFLAAIVFLIHARLGLAEFYEFLLPSIAIVGLVLLREPGIRIGAQQRFRNLLRSLIPFVCGVAAPVAVFLVPYARSGALGKFVSGVFLSAAARSVGLSIIRPVGPTQALFYSLPLVAVVLAAMYWEKFQSIAVGAVLALGAIALLYRATQSRELSSDVWCSVAALTPIVVLLGTAVILTGPRRGRCAELQHQQIVLLISLAATCSLVQFPFAAPIYLSYAVPLTLLALVAIVTTCKSHRGTYALASTLGFYLLFGVLVLVPRYVYELTHVVGPMDAMQTERSGSLSVEGAAFFDDLAQFLHTHSPNGKMYAGNDCPELYFLSGLQNVAWDDTGMGRDETLQAVKSNDLHLVVINEAPYFPAAAMSPEVKAEVAQRFPYTAQFGIFRAYWKP